MIKDTIYSQLADAFNDLQCVAIELELNDGELVDLIPKSLTLDAVSGIDSYGFRTQFNFDNISNVTRLYQEVQSLQKLM